jgi:parvulin-like peptidyl-prolyl isomerase
VSGRGAHLLRVEERRDDGAVHLRQIVFLRDEKAAHAAARARAEELLRRVRGDESFAEVARAESDDEVTRAAGGYLGKVPLEALSPAFREELEPLEPGDISGIVEDQDGLSIFQVDGKEGERPPTFDDVHDRLASLLEQRQAKEIYLQIIDEARQEVYVENRLASEG